MSTYLFGRTESGAPVHAASITDGALTLKIMEWGAALVDIRLAGVNHPLCVGFGSFAAYQTLGQHVGAIAGRFAGRLSGGFSLDGRRYETTRNDGAATLHGGRDGFGVSLWSIRDLGEDYVELEITQSDQSDGFLGEITARCRYAVAGGEISLTLTATSDAPTVCNMAQHSYFNLSGEDRIDRHSLLLNSGHTTELDANLLPTGRIVAATGDQDFSALREIGRAKLDGHFILARKKRLTPQPAATLMGGGVQMLLSTTEPGLVVYTADKFPKVGGGLNSAGYGPRAGICLESQYWPDSPNQKGFPDTVLRPGDVYRQETRYAFSLV